MAETIAVFGAEGDIGSSVVTQLAKYYKVKAIFQDPESNPNLFNANGNVTTSQVDIHITSSIQQVLNGVNAVFISTNTDFNSLDGYNAEVQYGKTVVEACAAASNIKHVIYNDTLSVVKILGLSARHMDSKCAIGEAIKKLSLPLTCIITPCFYEQLLKSPLRPKRLEGGTLAFEIPAGECPIDWMSVEDVGEIVANIFRNRDDYLHKTLSLSANKLTITEISRIFTNYLQPRHFIDKMLTVEQMRMQGFPGAQDLANMFDFYCRVDQRTNIDLTKKLYNNLKTIEEWLQENSTTIGRAMDNISILMSETWA